MGGCFACAFADQPLLLPLTGSLYVKGKVANTEQLLVNIGTDYFVEVGVPTCSSLLRTTRQLGCPSLACMLSARTDVLHKQPVMHRLPMLLLQMSTEQTQDYCKRKTTYVQKQQQAVQKVGAAAATPCV